MKPLLRGETWISADLAETLHQQLVSACLWKHTNCDWSDSSSEQAEANEQALCHGRGEVKSLHLVHGAVIRIVTEIDRAYRTTISFASERHPFEVRSFDHWLSSPTCPTCA